MPASSGSRSHSHGLTRSQRPQADPLPTPSRSPSRCRKPPLCEAPGATAGDSGNPQHLPNRRFLPSLRRGRIRLRLNLLSLVDVVRDTAVHRWEGLLKSPVLVQIIEAAYTEGFEEQWCGAPVLLAVRSELRRARHSLRFRYGWRG